MHVRVTSEQLRMIDGLLWNTIYSTIYCERCHQYWYRPACVTRLWHILHICRQAHGKLLDAQVGVHKAHVRDVWQREAVLQHALVDLRLQGR